MKKFIYLIVVIVAFGLIVAGCIPVIPPSEQGDLSTLTKNGESTVVWVDDDEDPGWYNATHFKTIQEGITAIAPYGIVRVLTGVYEEQIRIKKPLTLISDTGNYRTSETILTGNTTIFLDAHEVPLTDVIIQGFKFENINITAGTNKGIIRDGEGSPVKNITILSNSFININNPAIKSYINEEEEMSEGWKIIDNYIENILSDGVSGMALYTLTNSTISNNQIRNTTYAGMILESLRYVTVSSNYIYNTPRKGIQVAHSPNCNVTIRDNYITNTNTLHNADEGAITIYPDVTNILIEGNTLTGNYQGFTVRDKSEAVAADVYVNFNNIYDNEGFGVGNFAQGGGTLNATRNWWGYTSGPCRQLPNNNWVGKGDKVSSNVNYKPWSPHFVEICNNLSLTCTTIQDATLLTSDGRVITTGYDEWGYDYQAHMFNGYYCDSYRDANWCQEWKDVRLMMCWNDAWLSNKDCDGDGLLDRHYGYESYIGSGAWLTNHQWGSYIADDGKNCNWDYFVKIVAAPSNATKTDGVWYTANGTEIGPVIWGSFAIIQQVENDPYAGISGLQYSSPCGPGLGKWEGEFN